MTSRTMFLALCLCAAVSAITAEDLPAAPFCQDPPAVAGGWQTTDTVPDEVFSAIQVALVEGGNSTLSFCDDPTPVTLGACTQVVAGTNYQVEAILSCPEVDSSVMVLAEVYVPLPYSNEGAEVVNLDVLNVTQE